MQLLIVVSEVHDTLVGESIKHFKLKPVHSKSLNGFVLEISSSKNINIKISNYNKLLINYRQSL